MFGFQHLHFRNFETIVTKLRLNHGIQMAKFEMFLPNLYATLFFIGHLQPCEKNINSLF